MVRAGEPEWRRPPTPRRTAKHRSGNTPRPAPPDVPSSSSSWIHSWWAAGHARPHARPPLVRRRTRAAEIRVPVCDCTWFRCGQEERGRVRPPRTATCVIAIAMHNAGRVLVQQCVISWPTRCACSSGSSGPPRPHIPARPRLRLKDNTKC